MTLMPQIVDQLKTAMKAKDEVARDTLRMVKSQLTQAEIQKGAKLSDDEELKVLVAAVKSRKESAAQYDEGGRPELAARERQEIEIIQRFLPQAMSEQEAKAAITELVAELGVTEKKQMGQLMKAVMDRYRGQIDGKLASRIAGSLLS